MACRYALPRASLAVLMLAMLLGCTSDRSKGPDDAAATQAPLLEPFDAPTLAELDAQADWIENPVSDAFKMLAEHQAKNPPLVSDAEALLMKNDSTEANRKILSVLGRLPKNDDEVDWDATITRHIPADLKSTNPIMGSSLYEFDVAELTGILLFSFDWNLAPFASADVVESWHSSADHLVDKLVLRDDLTWSDGAPLTAHDFEFSFQTIMDARVPVPAVRTGTDKLRWVKAYDDRTLVFFHKEALATNVGNMVFPILPKHIYAKSIDDDPTLQNSEHHVKFEDAPVTSGAYKVVSRTRGEDIVLERREEWFIHNDKVVRQKPYIKRVRFRVLADPTTALLAVKKGDLHMTELDPEQWTTQTIDDEFYRLNTKSYGVEWSYAYVCWNCKSPLFDDVRVRTAMALALDHREMIDKICYGLYEPGAGTFYPAAWMAPQPPIKPLEQNRDQAEKLLAEAGWEDHDGDGTLDKEVNGRTVNFDFDLLTSTRPIGIAICTLFKQNLETIGIQCTVRPLEFTVLQEKSRNHEFAASSAGWGTGTDPDTTENIFGTSQGRNYGEYSNPEVDKLFAAGRREFDRTKRAEIYGKIGRILWEDQPYTWLYYRSSFYAFNKDLRGYMFSPRGPFGYTPGFNSIWKVKQ